MSVRFWQHHWLRLSKPDSHSLIGWDPTCQSAFYIVSYIGCPKSNTHIEYFDWSFVLWRCPEETNPWVIHISPNRDYNRRKAVRIIINQLKMVWSLSLYLQGTFFFFKRVGGDCFGSVILMMKFIKTWGWLLVHKWIVWILITSHWSLKSYYLLF